MRSPNQKGRQESANVNADTPTRGRVIRCAVYTRKSTDEGLAQEFNSLDAQREAAEAYIASQKHEGWVLVPDAYNDGGFTGANMDRPALRRLLADIEADRIDCVLVYKVDRLSRSLLDFARIVEIFEKHRVSFVSVTQQLNSSSSMGRLTLNILLSFAQFEREMIAERTRDKMSAARRKGKWVGGIPVLGYDVDPRGGRLVVNPDEAGQVQAIFKVYAESRSLIPAVRELNRRGWTTKKWTTKEGREHTGQQFTKNGLYRLLSNVIYTGQVNHKGTVYPGEHAPIVDAALWEQVQERLRGNGVDGGREVRNRYGALLRGLLQCDACGTAMVHTYTVKGTRRYRYYVCLTAQQKGWDACPAPAVEIADRFWPYEKPVPAGAGADLAGYIGQVRQMLLRPACVRASFSAADERLAAGLHRRGVTLTQLERAIWLGSPASTSLYSTARPPCSSLACTILPGWWMKSRRPAWLKATGSMCNGKRNNWKGGGLPVGTAGQRQSKRNDGNEIMSNLPRILKGAPCFCVRGMATIFLYLGNFQPAELGNFQPAQTGEFSTGTDTVSPRTDAQRIAHR